MNAIFIQANNKQLIGAKVAKFAMETRGGARMRSVPVTILNVDEMPIFQNFAGVRYRRGPEMRIYDPEDLQSFTLSRFLPPELMSHSGRALVIDPDVFALTNVGDVFDIELQDNAIAACPRMGGGWNSSVMLLDCAKLRTWTVETILSSLKSLEIDYNDLIRLRGETRVQELSGIWNNLDTLSPDTRLLHMTNRSTQPWKTGLPVDFTYGKSAPYLGFIPSEPLRNLLWPRPARYQPHPNKSIENLFFDLLTEALESGEISRNEISVAISKRYLRPDLEMLIQRHAFSA